MILLPAPFGTGAFVAWRLDGEKHAAGWGSGEGAFRVGGRWNSAGVRAVYMSLDPATAILELAVHKGFPALDIVPHTLTSATILDTGAIHIVQPGDVPERQLAPPLPAQPRPAAIRRRTSRQAFLRAHSECGVDLQLESALRGGQCEGPLQAALARALRARYQAARGAGP